jgi:hypothetical protein
VAARLRLLDETHDRRVALGERLLVREVAPRGGDRERPESDGGDEREQDGWSHGSAFSECARTLPQYDEAL